MKLVFWIMLLLLPVVVFADEIVTTKSGKKINLKEDGTWEVVSKKQVEVRNTKSAIATVSDYLKVNRWQDRINFVLDPDRVKPLFDEYYGKADTWDKPTFKIATKTEPAQVKIGDYVTVNAKLLKKTQNFLGTSTNWKDTRYYLQKTASGYKVDWESSVGYNEMAVAAFNAIKPSVPVRFRVLAYLSNTLPRNGMYSLDILSDGQSIGFGYINKNSTDGERVFNILKDGYAHYMVFDLKHIDNDSVLVQSVVSTDSWVVKN